MKCGRFFAALFLSWVMSSGSLAQDEEDTRYVRVDSSSNDAVLVDDTDFFEAKPLCRLIQNQEVTLVGESDGQYVKIRAVCKGKTIEGWIKKKVLGKKPVVHVPEVSPSGATDSTSMAAPASMDHGIPELSSSDVQPGDVSGGGDEDDSENQ